jgi:hypothetical protein
VESLILAKAKKLHFIKINMIVLSCFPPVSIVGFESELITVLLPALKAEQVSPAIATR